MPGRQQTIRLVLLRPRIRIAVGDIIRAEGAENYSVLFFKDGHQLKIALSIQALKHRVPELVRIHRRYLVNLSFVSVLYRHDTQASIKLTTGEVLPVARRRKHLVHQQLVQYRTQLQINTTVPHVRKPH